MARTTLKFETLEAREVPATSLSPLNDRMVDQMETSTGRNGFSVVTPGLPAQSHHANQVFGTSSTIKIGILYELMRKVDRPVFPSFFPDITLATTIDVGEQYGSNQPQDEDNPNPPGSLQPNTRFSLRFLAETMIDNSNNWATNRLIDYLGVDNINAAYAALGLTHTRVDRYMTGPGAPAMHPLTHPLDDDSPAGDYRDGHDNESTPAEMTSLLRQIHENNNLLTPQSYTDFWDIMSLNGSGSVSREYANAVFTNGANTWRNAVTLAVKGGSNNWNGDIGDFDNDLWLGDHSQRSEAGRLIFDNRVVFYAMFVDEAANGDQAVEAMGRAGFEIAREYATRTVTVTPSDAMLDDGRLAVVRGSVNFDNIRVAPAATANSIALSINGVTAYQVNKTIALPNPFPWGDDPIAHQIETIRVLGGDFGDFLTVAPGISADYVKLIAIDGQNGDDEIYATTSVTTPLDLAGNSHTVSDKLTYYGPGITNNTPQGTVILRAGHQPIHYSGFEITFDPPTITDVPDQSVDAGVLVGPFPFTVSDRESPATGLTVTAFSNDGTLIPSENITLTGTGAVRTISFRTRSKVQVPPTIDARSKAPPPQPLAITLKVVDETGRQATSSFRVTIASKAPKAAKEFSLGSDQGAKGTVTLRNPDNSIRASLTPFGESFVGGVRTAAADFTGDGIADLVAASGPGMAGQVLVYDGVTQAAIPTPLPGNLAFGESFTRGILVAAGDLNADGLSDLIITAEAGGGARVRVLQSTGNGFIQRSDFIALIDGFGLPDSRVFRGGSRATVSDINGDGTGDLIWAAGVGGGPRIATFDGTRLDGGSNTAIKLSGDFFALSRDLRDGCYLAGGDVNGDGVGDVVFGGGSGAPPQVVTYSGTDIVANRFVRFADFLYGTDSGQGIRVAVKDVNDDGVGDVIVASAPGAGSRVAAFDGKSLKGSTTGNPLFDFQAFDNSSGGIFVG